MYCDFFGLRCRPFEDRADAQFFCPLADSEEALAAMEYESHYGKGMALVLGDAGTGKTLLIRTLLQRLDKSDQVVVLTWSQAALRDLVRSVAKGFGVSLPSSHRDARCISRLRRSLTRALKSGHRSILIIDQAENLTSNQLAQLATLADIEHDGSKLLNIIMVGQPRLQALVRQPDFARLRQQLFGERTLKSLSLESAREYVKHRLRIAGGGDADVFDDDAIALIHEASGGIPRLINHTCNAAMLAAYGAGEKRIHRALAAEVVGCTCPIERSADAGELAVSSVDDVAAGLTGMGSRAISAGLERPDRGGTKESSHAGDAVGNASTLPEALTSGLMKTEDVSDPVDTNLVNHVPTEPVISRHDQEDSLLCDPGESAAMHVEEVVNRLERGLARADRVSATTEASLAQHQAMEKHLLSLSTGAERIATRLTSATERSSEVWGALQRRVEKVVGDGELRAEAIEAQVSRAAQASSETSEQMQRIENTCRHAEGIESSLRLYAERLADKADEVQQRITSLLKTLETGKNAQSGLDAAVERAASSVEEVERKIDAGLTSLAEANKEESRKRQQLIENTVLECGRELEAQKETYERLSREAEGARTRALQELVDRASAAAGDGNKTIELIGRTLSEAKEEVECFRKHFVEDAIADLRKGFEERREAHDLAARRAEEAGKALECKLQRFMDHASQVTSDGGKTIELIGRTLSEAKGEVECFRIQFVEDTIEDLRKGFEEQRNTHDLAARRAEEALERKLQQFMDRASATTADGNEMIGLMHAALKEVKAEAGDIKGRFIDEVLPDCREEIQAQFDAQLRRHQESIEVVLASYRVSIQKLIDESTPRLRSMEQAIADGRRNADEMITSFERSSAGLRESVSAGVNELREQMDTLEDRHDDVQLSVGALSDDVGKATSQVRDLAVSVEDATSTVDALDQRADACRANLTNAMQQGDKLLQGMQAACGQAEATQRHLNASLIDAGATCERISTLRDQIAEGERVLTLMSTEQAEGVKTAGRLEELGTSGRQLHEALQGLVAHADGKLGQLDSHSAAATRILRDLTGANTAAHETKEWIDEAIQSTRAAASEAESTARAVADRLGVAETKADRVTEQAQQCAIRLETAEETAEQTAHRLESQVESAREQEGTLQGVLANTEETIGRLDSHHAAAGTVLRGLSEANVSGRTLLEQAGNTYAGFEQRSAITSEKLGRLSQEVAALISRVDESIGTLQAANTTGGELVDKITAATRPASETLDWLAATLEDARRHLADVVDHRRELDETAGRLQTLTDALESARNLQGGMEEAIGRARTTNDELTMATDAAARHSAALAELNESAGNQTYALEKLKDEAEAVGDKLTAQKEANDRSVEAGGPILDEFITRARTVEGRIGEFEERAERMERELRQATTAPAEVVAAAQAQAAQLERVCSAVRKIFGAVSRASLSAKQQSSRCTEVSERSARRLAQLSSEVDRATATIREWVEEAKRAQSRLEGTLQRCPSIKETHPAEDLRQLSDVLSPAGRIPNTGVVGEFKTLSEPGHAQATHPRQSAARPKRVDEIARLIQDAKEAVAEAKV